MKRIALIAGAGLMALSGIGTAVAQPASGTPNSPFPHAAPHEIRWINGVPCRTVYDYTSKSRIPVACAGPVSQVLQWLWIVMWSRPAASLRLPLGL